MLKNITTLAVGALLVLGLAACGGGGSASESVISTASAAQTTSVPVVEMYGDSTTHGDSYPGGAGTPDVPVVNNEPTYVQLLFNNAGIPAQVVNKGVGGTEARNILTGVNGYTETWDTMMTNSTATIVTINFGMNESVDPSETPADYGQNITQMISIARAHGKHVIVETPNHSCEPTHEANLPAYIEILRRVTADTGTPLVDQWADEDALNWAADLPDCIHPDEPMYEHKAVISYPFIMRMLQNNF